MPEDRRFQDLLLPYLAPYLIYVAISSLPDTVVPPDMGQLLKLTAAGGALLVFRNVYRFGPFKPVHLWVSLFGLPVALLCWVGPLYLLSVLGLLDLSAIGSDGTDSSVYFYLRLLNSVVLVAIFEELFIRVYVMGWLHQAGMQRDQKGVFRAIFDTLEQRPASLQTLPLSPFAVIGATIVFAAGHQAFQYLSCGLYLLFTTWLYKKSGSLWVCVIVHGLTNLAIGILVRPFGLTWLW